MATRFVLTVLLLLGACKGHKDAKSADLYPAEALGALHFEVSGGTPEAHRQFDRGLLALHSFWYDEAQKQFTAAIATDPTFAMAYWGLAMSHAKLLWGEDDLAAGRDALRRMPSPQTLPEHDQAWVMAAISLFRRANADVRASRAAFLAVMEQLHAKFPDDESSLFLALALLSTVRPGDPAALDLRKRAGGLAAEVMQRNPKHPGAAHYLIHAYDTPELAEQALPAAKLYATIAPAAFHAQHMPSHVYVRLGMWKEAAESCQAAWDASVAWVARDHLSIDHEDFHSLAWLVEIGFERARRGDADRALATYAAAVRAGLGRDKRAAYANVVASVLMRTGEAKRVDEWLAPLDAPAVEPGAGGSGAVCGGGPPPGAPGQWLEQRAVLGTRALAAAMLHDPAKLGELLAQRDAVDAQLRPFLVATQPPELVADGDRMRPLVRAALAARANNDDHALAAALPPLADDQENREFTGEGMADGLLYHEQHAEALLRIGDAKAALDELRNVLARHAKRARSLLDAARAATATNDAANARVYYKLLLDVWANADSTPDGLQEARQAIGTH